MGREVKSTRLIYNTEMSIYLSKDNLDEKILFGKNHSSLKPKKIRKIHARDLHENREFHVPLQSMIYLALKSELNALITF